MSPTYEISSNLVTQLSPTCLACCNPFQTETLLDSQLKILDEKLRSQRPLLQALDENVNFEGLDPKKSRNDLEKAIARKKFRIEEDCFGDQSGLSEGDK